MTENRSFFRRMLDSMIAARTREANRRIALYTASFTPDDIWRDLNEGRDNAPAQRRAPQGAPTMLMRAGG